MSNRTWRSIIGSLRSSSMVLGLSVGMQTIELGPEGIEEFTEIQTIVLGG